MHKEDRATKKKLYNQTEAEQRGHGGSRCRCLSCPPQRDLTPPPSHGATTASMLRPLSPSRLPQSHLPSKAAASNVWLPAFHGPANSPFCSIPLWPYNKCFFIQLDLLTTMVPQPGFYRWVWQVEAMSSLEQSS